MIRKVPRCDRIDTRRRLKATGEGAGGTAKAVGGGGGGGGGGAGGGVLPSKLLLQRVHPKDGKSEAVAADRAALALSHFAGPPRPPGEFWTCYRDGCEDWYFYDGPLGHWWSSDLNSEPEPYNDYNDPYNADNDEDSR